MIPGPTGLHDIGAAMAALPDRLVLFGGVGADSKTWEFDGTAWTSKTITAPSERAFHSMASLNGKVYLFGGETDANHFLNDTWVYDGTAWTELTTATAPSQRFHAAMTTLSSHIVLFGGAPVVSASSPPFFGDTWSFDGTSWTAVTPADAPSARYAYVMATKP